MPKVYVPNSGKHDLEDAKRFGELVYLTEGPVRRTAVRQHAAVMKRELKNSSPEDYVLVGSLSILTAVAVGIFAAKHKTAKLLLWEQGRYIERPIPNLMPSVA